MAIEYSENGLVSKWHKRKPAILRGKPKGSIVAHCGSLKCIPKPKDKKDPHYKHKTFRFFEKTVKPGTMDCPDCGHVLMWSRVN